MNTQGKDLKSKSDWSLEPQALVILTAVYAVLEMPGGTLPIQMKPQDCLPSRLSPASRLCKIHWCHCLVHERHVPMPAMRDAQTIPISAHSVWVAAAAARLFRWESQLNYPVDKRELPKLRRAAPAHHHHPRKPATVTGTVGSHCSSQVEGRPRSYFQAAFQGSHLGQSATGRP